MEKELFTVGKAIELRKDNFEDVHAETGFDRNSLVVAVNATYGVHTPKRYFLAVIESNTGWVGSTFMPHESYLADNFYYDEMATDERGWFEIKVDDMTEFLRVYGEGSG